MNRPHSVYGLTCWRCERELEIPCHTGPPYKCPICGALLQIEFRAALAEIAKDLDDKGEEDANIETLKHLKEAI